MHARLASGVFVALGFADLAVLNFHLAPALLREHAAEIAPCPMPPPSSAPAAATTEPAPPREAKAPAASAPPRAPAETIDDVRFRLQSERVESLEAAAALGRAARALAADPSRRIALRGHADRLGQPAANLVLSRRRAEAVKQLLVMHGAPAERIEVQAAGDAEPVDPSDTPAAWAKNRRVQVLWR